jgi:hypothetical protein
MGYFETASAKAATDLQPGEQVTAANRFQAKGQAMAMAAGGLVGAAIASVASKGDRKAAAEAGVKLPQRGVLVVTDRRVLVYSQSAFAARPKKLLAEIPNTLVGAAPTGKGVAPAMVRTRLSFSTGGSAEIDLVKRDGAERTTAAINAVVGRPA